MNPGRDTQFEKYGEEFGKGDVIGCAINQKYSKIVEIEFIDLISDFASNRVYFTKNGDMLGCAYQGVQGRFHPAVSLHQPKEV